MTAAADDADLVVVNTCAVTREAAKKSRQLIRRSRRRNANARLVVSGCYSSLQPGVTEQLPGIDLVVDNADKDRLVDIVKQRLALEAMPVTATEPDETALFSRGRNRAFIKVQDGCRHQCTFCIVTVARGAERSRTPAEIVAEVNSLHGSGVREAVLTGVHIGGYGHDLGSDLPALIRAVLAETDIPRLRLGSLEPWNIGGGFPELFDNPRFMPHLHLPMQSGSDSVLQRMGRRCKRARFLELAARLRQQVPDLNISTDIIAGFPGETAGEWRQTIDFCREAGFPHVHVFPYSARAGTRAARLPGQLPPELKKQRCAELRGLAAQMKHAYRRRFTGRDAEVLVESDTGEVNGQAARFGYTPNYLRTALPVRGALPRPNSMVTVRIGDYDERSATLLAQPPVSGDPGPPASPPRPSPGRPAWR